MAYNTATTLEYRYRDWIHKWDEFGNIKGVKQNKKCKRQRKSEEKAIMQ